MAGVSADCRTAEPSDPWARSRRTRPGATMGRAAEDLPNDRPDRRDPAAPDRGRGLRGLRRRPGVARLADRAAAPGRATERGPAAAAKRTAPARRPRPADERLARATLVPAARASSRRRPQPRRHRRRARPARDRDLLL